MRISTQAFFQRSAAGMGKLQQELFRVQEKLGAGTTFLRPSDNPVASARALGVKQAMSESAQYASSRSRAEQMLSRQESELQTATTLLQDVKTLIIQAGNGTMTDDDRTTLATALEGKFAELLGVANADDGNGQYLFAGFKSDTSPFVQLADGSVLYRGDLGQRLLQVDVSRQMAATDDGATIFRSVQGSAARVTTAGAANTGTGVFSAVSVSDAKDYVVTFLGGQYSVDDGTTVYTGTFQQGQPIVEGGLRITVNGTPADNDSFTVSSASSAGADIFGAMRDLITTLRAGSGTPAAMAQLQNSLSTANVKITNAHDNVLTVRSAVGSRLAELDTLGASGDWKNVVDEAYLSQLQDLDYASALSQFAQLQVNLQATMQTFSRLQGIALFNYL